MSIIFKFTYRFYTYIKYRVMEEIITRIKEYVAARKLNGASFARELGMSSVSVNQWLSEKRKVSWEFIQAILNNDEKLSANWLTRGIGEMYAKEINSNEYNQEISNELADAKMKMLIKDGIIRELKDMILEKNKCKEDDKDKFINEHHVTDYNW